MKSKIQKVLKEKHPGEDLSLYAFGIPYGFWVWSEEEEIHHQLKSKDLDQEIRDTLLKVTLTKSEVFKK